MDDDALSDISSILDGSHPVCRPDWKMPDLFIHAEEKPMSSEVPAATAISELMWRGAKTIGEHFSDHYSATWEQQRALFDEALKLKEGDWVVELGVCNGRTAAVLSFAASATDAKYIGVDHFGLENSAAGVRDLLEKYGLNGSIWDINTHAAGRIWDTPISLLFIDAGHDEANVKQDIELWLPWVKNGGVVAFHDWDEPYNPESAHWAVRHYGELATQGWKKIECPPNMAMFRRPV
jgi:predicted O-methyltransferase YrrM